MLKYEEGRCIGRGSYGSAHLVTERATNQRYVIKKIPMELLSESEKQQSFREVELLAKLKHPNVVEYKENFVENNVIHIVMAYCDGGDLAGRIKERAAIAANGGHGYFDTRQILDWFVQMAMAIKYLHEQRILHRDLKTSNIFLTTQNVIKLGDFGIAKTLDSTLDQAKTVVGTPYYMSPEVCESKPYSYASDVWSLGCVLYEIVALKHAFDAPNILTLILKIVQNDFAAVPAHYDPEISDILKRLLDKRPEVRPTMDQIFAMPYVRNHMQALVESGGSLKMTAVARRPHGTPKRRTPHAKGGGRRASADTSHGKSRRGGGSAAQNRWAAISPTDREEVVTGDGSDLELLDASGILDESSLDIRLPERSRTPEPLVMSAPDELGPPAGCFQPQKPATAVRPSPTRKKAAAGNGNASGVAWVERRGGSNATQSISRRSSAEEVEEELDNRFQVEAAEALMNPNFQRVYAEECDDSLTVKYAPQSRSRARQQQQQRGGSGKPPKPGHDTRRRVFDLAVGQRQGIPPSAGAPRPSAAPYSLQERGGINSRRSSGSDTTPLTLTLSLEDSMMVDGEHVDATNDVSNLSDSGMLRQLELEEASSSDENEDAYSSNSDDYDGEENFYSEHSAYSDDSDFAGEENEAEYSDDFEELDGEIIEYANEDFAPEEDPASSPNTPTSAVTTIVGPGCSGSSTTPLGSSSIRSPKQLASSPASHRAPREVQWVMRNVAQSLMESCDNLSVA